MQSDNLRIVKETITLNCSQPLQIKDEDLDVGLQLLTKIATEKILSLYMARMKYTCCDVR